MSQVIGKTRCPSCAKTGKDTSGDNLILYKDGSSYCFSCGFYQSKSKRFVKQAEVVKTEVSLPEDILQLQSHHPGYFWIKQYLDKVPSWILWSPKKQWMIFPYIVNGTLEAWQARNFSGEGPKWLSFGKLHDILHVCRTKCNDTIFLVEDIISAIKIEQAGGTAMPLFGSVVGLKRFEKLSSRFKSMKLWLDPDKAFESSQQAYKANKLGFNVQTVKTDKDPKEHDYKFIEDILDKTL